MTFFWIALGTYCLGGMIGELAIACIAVGKRSDEELESMRHGND